MSRPSTLLLPIWSQTRELDAKLLLACAAAERGIPTLLGSRAKLEYHAHQAPRGVYLAKGGYSQAGMFWIMRRLGHDIVLLDEASLLRARDDEVRARRLKRKAVQHVSRFLAWGEDDARVLRETPQCEGIPVHVTGNPRMDMTRPELRAYYDDEVAALRARHGEFVLLNTNFSSFNHAIPALSDDLAVAHGTAPATDYYRALAAHRLRIFDALRALVPQLARALGDVALVVRPHPFESPDLWREAAAGARNVTISQSGNVYPWLHAASVVIANGCTTLLEAHLLGRPAISFEPIVDAEFDDPLPPSVAHRCTTSEELFVLVERARRGELPLRRDPESQRLHGHLTALDGAFACDRIVDVLVRAGYAERSPRPPHPVTRIAGIAANVGRTLWKRAAGDATRHGETLHAHRFPDLLLSDLERRAERFAKLTGRFSEIRIEAAWPHVFQVSSRRQKLSS